jgi:predicted Fe-Mo cluster-binding NifX family protein
MSRVAISVSTMGGQDPAMDPRFGRAVGFLVLDERGSIVQYAENPHKDAGHGAGPAAAGLMHELGVEAVISGEFGPKALSALTALGIAPYLAPPGLLASEAHRRFVERTLERKTLVEYR